MKKNLLRKQTTIFKFILLSQIFIGCNTIDLSQHAVRGHVIGIVSSFNYTKRGDIDGYILENGVVVHVGPNTAKYLNIAKGDQIEATGDQHSSPSGAEVIEANKINGKSLKL